VCNGDRRGTLDLARLQALAMALREGSVRFATRLRQAQPERVVGDGRNIPVRPEQGTELVEGPVSKGRCGSQ